MNQQREHLESPQQIELSPELISLMQEACEFKDIEICWQDLSEELSLENDSIDPSQHIESSFFGFDHEREFTTTEEQTRQTQFLTLLKQSHINLNQNPTGNSYRTIQTIVRNYPDQLEKSKIPKIFLIQTVKLAAIRAMLKEAESDNTSPISTTSLSTAQNHGLHWANEQIYKLRKEQYEKRMLQPQPTPETTDNTIIQTLESTAASTASRIHTSLSDNSLNSLS